MMENILLQLAIFLMSVYQPIYYLALFVASVFVVSGLADLFFDFIYMGWNLRRLIIGRHWRSLTLERLETREQQRIAIFIAAWKESDVIAQTLRNAVSTIRYRNYDVFVGTYPNDPDTQREVDIVARENSRVHKVITPDNGPTNKASNLNHVFKALLDYENSSERYFDIIVMHDAEDVIHPYSLLVYNYLMPRMEMIQIPVFPMALPLKEVTHWTYADEFAENHTKILRVREITGGFVPSAGVGTGFTKRSFQLLAIEHEEIFSPNSLTEDYQLGLRMNLMGMKSAFVNVNIPSPQTLETGKNHPSDWVATRAVFPTDFKRAVKQKTRWNIGIVLQGWRNMGWKGPLSVKWNLFNDRKALIATPVNFLAYIVFAYFLLYSLINMLALTPMPVLIPEGSTLSYLVLISTIFMVWRSLNRAYAVNKIYGFLPAVTSIPRAIWGNIINFFAIIRAISQYTINKFRRKEVAWDKTTHEFPAGVTEEGKQAVSGMQPTKNWQEDYNFQCSPLKLMRMFSQRMKSADENEKIALVKKISRDNGDLLFPKMIKYILDPSWQVRAAVCRSLSYLRLPQAIPYLKIAAHDQDWVVRSNAVRALAKLEQQGENALLHLLHSKDRYARDAARTVLEQQGFLTQYDQELRNNGHRTHCQAFNFLDILANEGNSPLAHEIVESHR